MKSKVLYLCSNTEENYYNLWTKLRKKFDERIKIDTVKVNKFIETLTERFYVKELSYQLEIYNASGEYVFCINKPI